MEDYIARAEYYREKAEEAAAFVDRMSSVEGKRMMAAIAQDFLQMAEMLERLAAQGTKQQPCKA
jgi:CHASE3 domain sensor protein